VLNYAAYSECYEKLLNDRCGKMMMFGVLYCVLLCFKVSEFLSIAIRDTHNDKSKLFYVIYYMASAGEEER
jgi:hypothetical protein